MSIGQIAQSIVDLFMIAAWAGSLGIPAFFVTRRCLHIPFGIYFDGGMIFLFIASLGLLHRLHP